MRYLHTMIRVSDIEKSLAFYCGILGMQEVYRYESEKGRFTNIFLKAPGDDVGAPPEEKKMGMSGRVSPVLELTYNWDSEKAAFSLLSKLHLDFLKPAAKKISAYPGSRNFGHLAYEVENIYETCKRLMDGGIVINRPPRDGKMAFIRSPDGISIELLQKGEALALAEPWVSMANTGSW